MKIRFAARAQRDLSAISAYLVGRNPSAAIRVGDAIERTIRRLELFPLSGRLQQGSDSIRKLVVPAYGYLVYYRVDDDGIMILTVRHGARKRILADR